ncbi:AAA family ATPase [Agriterribacter sp.]|uniref:AAA family ATPase n=1 Tax=Agriterribacter sp. TaxID=2821509 RepID=UPI002BBD4C02|nr:AAA family ATPase [Agriterribacter sp.]HTN05306.1 AAA family ATPase [Agriterribacter sp.]
MKIAIAGAHRVGKTTLTEKLQEHLPDYTLNIKPYYELEESGYVFSERPDVDDFIKQFDFSIKQITKSGDNTIFDRCPIDILTYIHVINETKDIQSFFNKAQTIITGIDLLVFVSVEEPDLIPCQKSDLPELRYKVNEIFNDWVWDFGAETIIVNGALLTRIDQILGKIS